MTEIVNTVLGEVIESLKQKGYFSLFHDLDQERKLEERLAHCLTATLNEKEVNHGTDDRASRRRTGNSGTA